MCITESLITNEDGCPVFNNSAQNIKSEIQKEHFKEWCNLTNLYILCFPISTLLVTHPCESRFWGSFGVFSVCRQADELLVCHKNDEQKSFRSCIIVAYCRKGHVEESGKSQVLSSLWLLLCLFTAALTVNLLRDITLQCSSTFLTCLCTTDG